MPYITAYRDASRNHGGSKRRGGSQKPIPVWTPEVPLTIPAFDGTPENPSIPVRLPHPWDFGQKGRKDPRDFGRRGTKKTPDPARFGRAVRRLTPPVIGAAFFAEDLYRFWRTPFPRFRAPAGWEKCDGDYNWVPAPGWTDFGFYWWPDQGCGAGALAGQAGPAPQDYYWSRLQPDGLTRFDGPYDNGLAVIYFGFTSQFGNTLGYEHSSYRRIQPGSPNFRPAPIVGVQPNPYAPPADGLLRWPQPFTDPAGATEPARRYLNPNRAPLDWSVMPEPLPIRELPFRPVSPWPDAPTWGDTVPATEPLAPPAWKPHEPGYAITIPPTGAPETQVQTKSDHKPAPNGTTRTEEPTRTRTRTRVRERKFKIRSRALWAIWRTVGQVTEGLDTLKCLHDSIGATDDKARRKMQRKLFRDRGYRAPTPQDRAAEIAANAHLIEIKAFMRCQIKNGIQDNIIGRTSQKADEAFRNIQEVTGLSRPFGFGAGPADNVDSFFKHKWEKGSPYDFDDPIDVFVNWLIP